MSHFKKSEKNKLYLTNHHAFMGGHWRGNSVEWLQVEVVRLFGSGQKMPHRKSILKCKYIRTTADIHNLSPLWGIATLQNRLFVVHHFIANWAWGKQSFLPYNTCHLLAADLLNQNAATTDRLISQNITRLKLKQLLPAGHCCTP